MGDAAGSVGRRRSAVAVTLAAFVQVVTGSPERVGAVGAVRSSRTVACTQADVLPALSSDSNCTSVWPSAVTFRLEPAIGADQVEPPLVEVSYW